MTTAQGFITIAVLLYFRNVKEYAYKYAGGHGVLATA